MKRGCGGDVLEKFENGIESLDVADLQDAIFLLRQFAQFGGLLGTVGHRFFDEDMFALREQLFGDVEMGGGGRDDVQRVAGGGGFGDGGEDAQLVFLRDFAGGFGVRVVNAGEVPPGRRHGVRNRCGRDADRASRCRGRRL